MQSLLIFLFSTKATAEPFTHAEQVKQYVRSQQIFVPYYFEANPRPNDSVRLYVTNDTVSINEAAVAKSLEDTEVKAAIQDIKKPILLFVTLTVPIERFNQIVESLKRHEVYLAVQEPCGMAAALQLSDVIGTKAVRQRIFMDTQQVEYCQKGKVVSHFNDCEVLPANEQICNTLRQSYVSSLTLEQTDSQSDIEVQLNHNYATQYTLQHALQTVWYLQQQHPTKVRFKLTDQRSCGD